MSKNTPGISSGSRLRRLLEAERTALSTLCRLVDSNMVPEARLCLEELRYAATWLCEGLERHVPGSARRRPPAAGPGGQPSIDPVMAAPTDVDCLRLVNRAQRKVLTRIDGLLAEALAPELRSFLEETRMILTRGVAGCDGAIAVLDLNRELQVESPDRPARVSGASGRACAGDRGQETPGHR